MVNVSDTLIPPSRSSRCTPILNYMHLHVTGPLNNSVPRIRAQDLPELGVAFVGGVANTADAGTWLVAVWYHTCHTDHTDMVTQVTLLVPQHTDQSRPIASPPECLYSARVPLVPSHIRHVHRINQDHRDGALRDVKGGRPSGQGSSLGTWQAFNKKNGVGLIAVQTY